MNMGQSRLIVEPAYRQLTVTAQCRLLSISRSGYYYAPVLESAETLALIDTVFMVRPWYGSRQMARHLQGLGHAVGRRRTPRLLAKLGLVAIYQRPRTNDLHPEHRIYPNLLRNLPITRPSHVWVAGLPDHHLPHSALAGKTPAEVYGQVGRSDYGGRVPHNQMNKLAA